MGEWRPKYVIWENVKNVKSKYMRPNFDRYMSEMERLGYSNNHETLDAREFGLPQARERVFTVSVLDGEPFNSMTSFGHRCRTCRTSLSDVPDVYDVTQPSVLECIGAKVSDERQSFKIMHTPSQHAKTGRLHRLSTEAMGGIGI